MQKVNSSISETILRRDYEQWDGLQALQRKMFEVASSVTAYDSTHYIEAQRIARSATAPFDTLVGRLEGHCGCVAYVVQKRFGGDIMHGKVPIIGSHYWNRIEFTEAPDDNMSFFGEFGCPPLTHVAEVDLTRISGFMVDPDWFLSPVAAPT